MKYYTFEKKKSLRKENSDIDNKEKRHSKGLSAA